MIIPWVCEGQTFLFFVLMNETGDSVLVSLFIVIVVILA